MEHVCESGRVQQPLLPNIGALVDPVLDLDPSPTLDSIFAETHNDSINIDDFNFSSELWNMETFWEDYLRPIPSTPPNIGTDPVVPDEPEGKEDEVARIASLFHQQTCHTLSICEETDQNPWTRYVWPMAKDYPGLYHAIAALTCICISRRQPHLRSEGTQHIQWSTQILDESVNNGTITLEAALATNLALAYAVTWDYDATLGTNYLKEAGYLIEQILSEQIATDQSPSMDFLLRTYTYMDVLARFTCLDLCLAPTPPTININLDPIRLDPLMGYSTSFFPTMRLVANLIARVRLRPVSRNSPLIISQAIELRRQIEVWSPPIDLETTDNPSQIMTDAIQTAEAYRYSTLLILYQAVPELPNLTSYGEIAQRILVYLATIPVTSTTIIAHIFPLMVAGCDAVEEEDREFVRERWTAMKARMVTAVVDRCLSITEELWARREEYLLARGLAFTANGLRISPNSNSTHPTATSSSTSTSTSIPDTTALASDIANFLVSTENSPHGPYTSTTTTSPDTQASVHQHRLLRKGNDFPISAAFKKGVDILTRSGSTEYTVRGRLHWLGVMKDWNWQGKLHVDEGGY